MTDLEELNCGSCGEALPLETMTAEADRSGCLKCGSMARHLKIRIHDDVGKIRDSLAGKVKNQTRSGKAKVRSEFFYGADKRRSRGDYVHKEREIDRDADRYRELIVEESGKVIRSVDEPLSAHVGHGSARTMIQPPRPRRR